MKINDNDQKRLDDFLSQFFDFLEAQNTNSYYEDNSELASSGLIKKMDGLVLPISREGPVVLDNEFKAFIIGSIVKLMRIMYDEAGEPLFGFAERTLYEYITTWGFLFISGNIKEEHKSRLKALIFSGHYKYIDINPFSQKIYQEEKGKFLNTKDLLVVNNEADYTKFFDYQWDVAVGILSSYGERPISFLKRVTTYNQIKSHQHMRIHANPLAINEVVGNNDSTSRNEFLLALYARQLVDYFRHSSPKECEKLVYSYEKFIKNNKIKL